MTIDSRRLAEDAADVLARRGWTRGGPSMPDGSVCLLGALGVAAFGTSAAAYGLNPNIVGDQEASEEYHAALTELRDALSVPYSEYHNSDEASGRGAGVLAVDDLWQWNDKVVARLADPGGWLQLQLREYAATVPA